MLHKLLDIDGVRQIIIEYQRENKMVDELIRLYFEYYIIYNDFKTSLFIDKIYERKAREAMKIKDCEKAMRIINYYSNIKPDNYILIEYKVKIFNKYYNSIIYNGKKRQKCLCNMPLV